MKNTHILKESSISKDLKKLRLRFFLKLLFCYLIVTLSLLVLISLDRIFKLSDKLSFHFNRLIKGHKIEFPYMSDSSFLSIAILTILSISAALFCKYYIEYKNNEKTLESTSIKKTTIPKKAFAKFTLFMIFNDILGWTIDEITSSISASLSDVTAKELYLWVAYVVVAILLILSQSAEIKRIKLLNALEAQEDKTPIFSLRTIGFLFVLATGIISTSLGLSRCEMLNFKFARTILGQKIEFITNEGNVLLMLLCQSFLFVAIYGLMDIRSFKDLKQAIFTKEGVTNALRSLSLSLCGTVSVMFSISAINTLKDIELSSPAIIIPLLILIVANALFAFIMIKQFKEDKPIIEASIEEKAEEKAPKQSQNAVVLITSTTHEEFKHMMT